MTYEDFVEYISNLDPNYSIGIHGVTGDGNHKDKIPSILSQGLRTKGWGGILSNVAMFGKVKDLTERDYREMYNYVYTADGEGNIVNMIFAFPETYKANDGREFFLGSFPKVDGYGKGKTEAGSHNPLNRITEKLGFIPKEFILGYAVTKRDANNIDYYQNPDFFPYKEDFDQQFEQLLDQNKVMDIERAKERLKLIQEHPELFSGDYYKQLVAYIKARLEAEMKL